MMRKFLGAVILSCLAIGTAYPVATAKAAGTVGSYYEYSTNHPVQGWVGVGRRSAYCDYIKYPIKDCGSRRVCNRGKCWTRRACTFKGWDIRQTCY